MHKWITHSLATMTLAACFGGTSLADEAESRANCESLASLNAPAFEVEMAEWVAASAGADGMINDFEGCDFDPVSVQCTDDDNSGNGQCLAEVQVRALNNVGGGARNAAGESLYGAFAGDTDRFPGLALHALEWYSEVTPRDRVIASGRAMPRVTRPLCPYPQVARYDSGDPDDAASFTCR
jgi:hypothetical protein